MYIDLHTYLRKPQQLRTRSALTKREFTAKYFGGLVGQARANSKCGVPTCFQALPAARMVTELFSRGEKMEHDIKGAVLHDGALPGKTGKAERTFLVTVMKSAPKNTPVTPSMPKIRFARGEAMASRALEKDITPLCKHDCRRA
eukprot:1161745-Pelagomonas_calceolata.AAC.17